MSLNPLARLLQQAERELRPLTALLELTYRCNLLCSFCYNAPRDDRELDAAEWLEALDRLKAAGTFKVVLSGGEPLLHPGFWEIARGVRERGLVLEVYTNGVPLARPEAAERLAALAPFKVEISLHGPDAATHERLTGVSGSFEKVLAALGNLARLGVNATVKTPITRLNQDRLAEVSRLVEEIGYAVTFDPNIVPTDDGDEGPLSLAPDREALVRFFLERARAGGGLAPRPVEQFSAVCFAGRTTLAIDPRGDVFPCVAWRRKVCNILEVEDFGAIWRTRRSPSRALRYVRRATEAAMERLREDEPAAFATFCPAVAEKETGSPMRWYPAARVTGEAKYEAWKRLGEDERRRLIEETDGGGCEGT